MGVVHEEACQVKERQHQFRSRVARGRTFTGGDGLA